MRCRAAGLMRAKMMVGDLRESQVESERRRPLGTTLTLEAIFGTFDAHAAQHMAGGPAAADHLRGLEQGLGATLPASFRAFLTRFGGGLFFHGHEIFGARRVMIHDIELVPDILSIKRRLAAEGRPLPAHLVPFHRARGAVHLLDVGPEGGGEQVVALDGPASFPSLASFLETVVVPRHPVPGPVA
jgi:hypothetical protein